MSSATATKRRTAVIGLSRFMASEGYPASKQERQLLAQYANGRLTIDEVCAQLSLNSKTLETGQG